MFVSHNGKIIPLSKACVPLTNLEFSYGFGVYETIKLRNKVLYFLDRHVNRLLKSAQIIELEHPFEPKQIQNYIRVLVSKQTSPSINIKVLMIGAENPANTDLYIIALPPLFPDRKLYKRGCSLTTVNYERLWPNAKTLNMIGSYLAYRKAKKNQCYDSLLINRHQEITEGTRTNFYTIKGKTIYSPPEKDILLGVTRDTVLETAQKNGFKLIIKKLKASDLDKFDGAFITSTSTKIMPVKKIVFDCQEVIYPEICENIKNLISLYSQFLKQYQTTNSPILVRKLQTIAEN